MLKIEDLVHQFISILFTNSENISKDKVLKKMLHSNIKEQLDSWTKTIDSWKVNIYNSSKNSQSVTSESKNSSSYLENNTSRSKTCKEIESKASNYSNDKHKYFYSENQGKIKFDDELFEKLKLWENGFDKGQEIVELTNNEKNYQQKVVSQEMSNNSSKNDLKFEETVSSKKSDINSNKDSYKSNRSISKNSSRFTQNNTIINCTDDQFQHSYDSPFFNAELSNIAPTITYRSQNGSSVYLSNENNSSKPSHMSPMKYSSRDQTNFNSTITGKKDQSLISNSSDRSDMMDSIAINSEILLKLEELSNHSSIEKESECINQIRDIMLKYRNKFIDCNKIELDSNVDKEEDCDLTYKLDAAKQNYFNNTEFNEVVNNNDHLINNNVPNEISSEGEQINNLDYQNHYEKETNVWDNKIYDYYTQNIQNNNINENIILDGNEYKLHNQGTLINMNDIMLNNPNYLFENSINSNQAVQHQSLLRKKRLLKSNSEPFQQPKLAPGSSQFIPNNHQQNVKFNHNNENPNAYGQNVYMPTNNYLNPPVTNHCNIGQYNIITTNSNFSNQNQQLMQSNNGQVFHLVSGPDSQTNINQMNNVSQTNLNPNQNLNNVNNNTANKTNAYNGVNTNESVNLDSKLKKKLIEHRNIKLANNNNDSFTPSPDQNNNSPLKKVYEEKNHKINDSIVSEEQTKHNFEYKPVKQVIQENKATENRKFVKPNQIIEKKVQESIIKKESNYENLNDDLDRIPNIQQNTLDTNEFLSKQKNIGPKTSSTVKVGVNEFKMSKCERKKLKKDKKKILSKERKSKKNLNEVVRYFDKSNPTENTEILEENLLSPLYHPKNELDQLIEKYKSVKSELISIIKSQNDTSKDTHQILSSKNHNINDFYQSNPVKVKRDYLAFNNYNRNNDSKLFDNDLDNYLQDSKNCFSSNEKSSYIKDQLKTLKKINNLKMSYVTENNKISNKSVRKRSNCHNFNFVNRDFESSLEKINNRIKNIYAKFVKNKDISSKNKELFQKIVDEYLEQKNCQFLDENIFIQKNEKIYRDQVNDLEKSIKEESYEFNDSNSFDFMSECDKTNFESENRQRYLIESIQSNIAILEELEQNSPSIKFNLQSQHYIKNSFKGNNVFFIFNDYFDFVSKMEARKGMFDNYNVIYLFTYSKMKNSYLEAITFATEDFVIALNMNFGIKKSEKVKEMIFGLLSDPKKLKVTIDVRSTVRILNKNLDMNLKSGNDWYDVVGVADSINSIKPGKLFLEVQDGTNTLMLEQLSLRYLNECIEFSQQIEWNNLSYFSNEYQCKKIYTNLLAQMQIYKHQMSYSEKVIEGKEYLKDISFSLDEIIKQGDGRFLFDNSMKKGYTYCQNVEGLNISISNKDANYYRMQSTAKNECRQILTNDSIFAYIFKDTKLVLLIEDELSS